MISTRSILAALVGVNLCLGAAFVVRHGTAFFERQAQAQLGGGPTIQVVGGTLGNAGTIYILNQTTGDLVILQTDTARKQEVVIDRINVQKDLAAIK